MGGELLRLLACHPETTVAYAVSARLAGQRIDVAHPNLRGVCGLSFCAMDDVGDCDVAFLATPSGVAMTMLGSLRAGCVIDLSPDFRLRDAMAYRRYYGTEHAAPERLGEFVTGCPELFRERLRDADLISVPGCMATAATLALAPLSGLLKPAVQVSALTGSSGAGASRTGSGAGDTHAERSGAMRVYSPVRHRHEAEVAQHTGFDVRMTVTAVEAVRGVQVVCHASGEVDERGLRRAFRDRYGGEPFIRIVARSRGAHRLPDPKILSGSNYCDIGFAAEGDRVTVVAALDNLVKGGSGNAVQCLNIRMGWPERLGLEFTGLHPI
jgi:N-acetyl-gamma-glutamyl-phosphate/LysW-gamma-L-alpha-aminoadipyl-6-phosphate reductase